MSETAKAARAVLRAGRLGTFGAVDFETGGPYLSLANYVCTDGGHPLFLFSRLARHTKCLLADARASLLVVENLPKEGDPLTGLRATFMGRARQVAAGPVAEAYLAKHPYAGAYAGFGDFSFWMLEPELVHIVGGFGRIETLKAADVLGA
ncbi:MAG: pyridoxamine 5'-phosphate oxidase family protein [Alphaproteobacteria bacterium]|nr:pyridoxamine 5'-phosphate oxidase family protein [Alphaproteobacteria bacterium]